MSDRALGSIPPRSLEDVRLQSHWALQCVAAVGVSYVPAREDDSHPNTGWDRELRGLRGRTTPLGFSAALRIRDLSLVLLDSAGVSRDEFPLDGHTLNPSLVSGSVRTRWPLAAKIALQIAGATGGSAGSPMPVGGLSLWIK